MPDLGCINEADLRAFLLGDLPPRVADLVANHLSACRNCEATACRLDGLTDPIVRTLRRAVGGDGTRLNVGGETPAPGLAEPPTWESKPFAGDSPPGYEILGELARGGMSVVYRARQKHPRRDVAIKMILAAAHAGPVRKARFLAEADAIARLQHPNIVGVYEVGEHAGLPYLSLEYVAGGTLADRLTEAPLPPRAAAALVETLARAVQYAHDQGVVHRDLKPSNVLMQLPDGAPPAAADEQATSRLRSNVPKIADFGLAKQAELTLTATGDILGTPQYMAPEQADGTKPAGVAVDVYALGAVLYECLTCRPPFCGANALDTLEQVRSCDPLEPRLMQPGVPRDLETICLKCLAKEPYRRYATAEDLAADLGRFLKGEPVRARPAGLWERGWKWVRRRPALAAALGAVAVVATLLSVTAVVSIWQAMRATRAEAAAFAARDAEAEQRRRTRAALDDMLSDESLAFLTTQKGLQPAQRAFLKRALGYYQEFANRAATDEEGQELVAKAQFRVAHIDQTLGQRTDAEAAYRAALAAYEKLAADFPAVPDYRADLATTHNNLGNLLRDLGRRTEAEAAHQAALAMREKLADEHPGTPDYRRGIARSHNNLGLLSWDMERWPEAEAAYQRALDVQEKLAVDFPADAQVRRDLAYYQSNLGLALRRQGKRAEAEVAHRASLATKERLAADTPASPETRRDLASGYNNLALLLQDQRKWAEAEAAHRAALKVREKLVHDFPAVPDYVAELAGTFLNLGKLFRDRGELAAALDSYAKAVILLEPVYQIDPRPGLVQFALRNSHAGRARALDRLRRFPEALADWDRSLALDDGTGEKKLRLDRALTLGRAGEAAKALAAADALAERDLTAAQVYDRACVYALAAGANLPPADAAHAATSGVKLLRLAVARGYSDFGGLLTDADLARLRGRAEFADFLWDLADAVRPAAGPRG